MADAAQERLELENKLMALQAKKEQMDSLLGELQQLREAQLRKGIDHLNIAHDFADIELDSTSAMLHATITKVDKEQFCHIADKVVCSVASCPQPKLHFYSCNVY
jgi:hypothetical protein